MGIAEKKSTDSTGWSSDLSVGIPELDEEHRCFFSMTNDLDQALNQRKDKPEIQRIMKLMVEDAIRHFEHEERLFTKYGYPNTMFHAGMHAQIVSELMKIEAQFDAADFSVEWTGKGMQIQDLLMSHLLEADMKYRDFFRDRRQISQGTSD
jgi:hemerythrin-like metal-binding protein